MKKTIYSLLIIIICSHFGMAQYDYGFDFSKSGTAGLQFLKIGVGAREASMGEAFTSLSNDVNSVFWNVAGIGFITNRQITFSHAEWLVESSHDAFVISFPIRSFVLAVSGISFQIKEFEETTVLDPNGTGNMVGAGDYLVGFALARRFTDKLTIGMQMKYAQETLDNRSFSNVLFDIGTIYYTGFHDLKLAFSLQHFGPDMRLADQQFRMPLLFRIGASDRIFSSGMHKLVVSTDLVHPTDANEWLNVGAEYKFLDILALRSGLQVNDKEERFTAGFGLQVPQKRKLRTSFDYAYVAFGEIFGATHRFTVALSF